VTEPRLDFVQCLDGHGLHRMAYWEWGDPHNPKVLLCVHGLTRQGRDFDALARALAGSYRVACPDVVGRGRSDWLANPMEYQLSTYVADMVTLLARLRAETVDWLGTSMGGLIGILFSALSGSPIRSLVINDIGPTLQAQGLGRIGTYVSQAVRFATVEEAADYLSSIAQGFGRHTREQWLALTRPMLKPAEDGAGFVLHYDPRIAVALKAITPTMAAANEATLWQRYDAVRARTLLIRGDESDLLSRETAQAMTQRGPRAILRSVPGVGHAPTFVHDDQIAIVREFLG
jgi:pimeloyl-ACP methyl ester carboxylesterase